MNKKISIVNNLLLIVILIYKSIENLNQSETVYYIVIAAGGVYVTYDMMKNSKQEIVNTGNIIANLLFLVSLLLTILLMVISKLSINYHAWHKVLAPLTYGFMWASWTMKIVYSPLLKKVMGVVGFIASLILLLYMKEIAYLGQIIGGILGIILVKTLK